VGDVRRITTYTVASQQITHDAFGYNNATTMTYDIYLGVPPTSVGLDKGLDTFINTVLRQRFYKKPFLLSEAPDADMEASGTTSYSGTNATLAKATSGSGVTEGDQGLQVTTTAANGYATLATALACSEGEVVEVIVDLKPTSGSWKLRTWDVTAGAEIDVTDAYAGVQARRLWVRSSIPASCETFNVRLIGETDATVCVFDNLSIRFAQRRWLNLPTWFLKEDWLEEVWVYPPGTKRDSAYDIRQANRHFMPQWSLERNDTANQPFRLEWGDSYGIPTGSHVFIESLRPYSEISADTDSSDIDKDWLRACVLALIWADKGDQGKAVKYGLQARAYDRAYNQRVTRRQMMGRP